MIGVQRLFENAAVELEPGKLAVDEPCRAIPEILALVQRLHHVHAFLPCRVHPIPQFRDCATARITV